MSKILQRWAAGLHVARIDRLERESGELRSALAAEREKTRQLAESLAEARKASAENVARIAVLERESADTQTELRVAQSENRLLSEIHEADVSRRKRERAIYDRDRARATASMPSGEEGAVN